MNWAERTRNVGLASLFFVPFHAERLALADWIHAGWMRLVLGAGLSLFALFRMVKEDRGFSRVGLAVLCLIFSTWCLFTICVTQGSQQEDSFVFTVYLLVGFLWAQSDSLDHLLEAISICLVIQAAVALVLGGLHIGLNYSGGLARIGGTLHHANKLSTILAFGLPLATARAVYKPSTGTVVAVLLVTVALLLTWSRAAIIGGAIGSMVPIFSRSLKMPKLWKLSLVGGFVLFALVGNYTRVASPIRLASTLRSDLSRPATWRVAMETLKSHPMGLGVGNVELTVPARDSLNRQTLVLTTNPKNEWLLLGLAFGVPGLALGVALTFLLAKNAIESTGNEVPALRGMLLSSAGCCLFDSPFFASNQLILTGLLGVLVGLSLNMIQPCTGSPSAQSWTDREGDRLPSHLSGNEDVLSLDRFAVTANKPQGTTFRGDKPS